MKNKPADEEILSAVKRWGNRTMTYVVANVLAGREYGYRDIETPWLRRRLYRLEREGKVQRVPSCYAVQICWSVVEAQP